MVPEKSKRQEAEEKQGEVLNKQTRKYVKKSRNDQIRGRTEDLMVNQEKKESIIKRIKDRKEKKKIEEFKNKTELEKVEERREEVLAKGRKFKYPLQYAKYRIVALTAIISMVALMMIGGFLYLVLYKMQSTDAVLYRLTQLLPVPVASVDGEQVRYSDYLMIYKSTVTPIEQQQGKLGNEKDMSSMESHYKRMALSEAENYAYALKLANEYHLSVNKEEIDKSVDDHRKIGGVERSEDSFRKILEDNFGLTMKEYRRMIYLSLIKEKVSQQIDNSAIVLSETVQSGVGLGKTLKTIADEMGESVQYEETGGLVDKMNVDGGRAVAALKLEPGQTSDRFLSSSGDGYYFVTLKSKTESSVEYSSIKIPFSEFNNRIKKIREEGKIKEHIELANE